LLKKGGKTVYFGDIGPNSHTLLKYFEQHSGVKCGASENPAEYILNCIGAGATANATQDWAELWNNSPECAQNTKDIEYMHTELPKRPENTNAGDLSAKYATSYDKQFWFVLRRTYVQFWRSPVYIRAKFLECVSCSLFVGLSYVGMDHTIGGAQGAFSSVFMLLLISVAMINQSHVFAYDTRELYEVREALSNTFHWSCLLLCHTLVEIYWSTICQFFIYITYYWPPLYSGDANKAGFFFFINVLIFPMYYVTYGLAILYFSPDVPSASMINSNLFAAMLLFCGILNPKRYSPHFWSFMYVASPFTYFVQAFVGPILHNRKLECAYSELSIVDPPEGQTCGVYFDQYINDNGGYLRNPNEDTHCMYCPYTMQEQVVLQYGIKWNQHWRDFGIAWIYIFANVGFMLAGYYYFRVLSKNPFGYITKLLNPMSLIPKPRHEKDNTIFQKKPGDNSIGTQKKA
jgi:ATP-binding cassette subfamily G (WHITE) protein 2 (SNQ2)